MTANAGTAKVLIENKIGSEPTGVYKDFALALQRGIKQIRVGSDPVVRWARGDVREVVRSLEPDLFVKVCAESPLGISRDVRLLYRIVRRASDATHANAQL
jgi:hypothetical protein